MAVFACHVSAKGIIIMKIAVLCGGRSPERDVSISTGSMVASALRKSGHSVALIDSSADFTGDLSALFTDKDDGGQGAVIADTAPEGNFTVGSGEQFFGEGVIDICRSADIVFNAMHGAAGEDGTLQATFDLLGIRYTGSCAKGCVLAMDKLLTKQLFAVMPQLVRMPRGAVLSREVYERDGLPKGLELLGRPLVIKPVSGGSSVGVSIAETDKDLLKALKLAFHYEERVLIEEFIKGREFAVGVLGNEVLPAIEIKPKHGFYDYSNKYQKGMTEEICPADISRETSIKMQRMAGIVYSGLSLSVYARFDFIMSEKGDIYCLEANTLPGMTPTSLLPQEAAAAGIDFVTLCNTIVEESIKKYDKA